MRTEAEGLGRSGWIGKLPTAQSSGLVTNSTWRRRGKKSCNCQVVRGL